MAPVLDFRTVTAAWANLNDILDAADDHLPVTVRRDGRMSVVLDADRLRGLLTKAVPARAELVADAGGWSVLLPDLPIAGDGPTVEAAVTDAIDALREYAKSGSSIRICGVHSITATTTPWSPWRPCLLTTSFARGSTASELLRQPVSGLGSCSTGAA